MYINCTVYVGGIFKIKSFDCIKEIYRLYSYLIPIHNVFSIRKYISI